MNTANASSVIAGDPVIADEPKSEPRFGRLGSDAEGHELRKKTARGGLFSMIGQVAGVALRMGSMLVIARLVTPEEFGVVGMVTAFTGFLALFRDVGLSLATIQRATITEEQTSTLFWINCAAGGLLALLCAAIAPALALFYNEPRLLWVTVALAAGFIFYGASAQHRALLQRKMCFGVLTMVDIAALVFSIAASVAAAMAGMGYWALVIMAVGQAMASAVGVWIAVGWMPGMPRRHTGVRSMMRFGGVITFNSLIVYLAYNMEKILLGFVWGPVVLGVYNRAYQLINLPSDSLTTVISSVMFPALSRVQNDPVRLRSHFIKGYGMFLAMLFPVTVACGLFADDIVRVLLGPQWTEAVPLFRLLTPTMLAFAMINPLAWLMQASGMAKRSLRISFLIVPVVVGGYALGLPNGSAGVALGLSVALCLLILPVMKWATHGTLITMKDMLRTTMHPALAVLAGGIVAVTVDWLMRDVASAFLRLCAVSATLFSVYALVLLVGLGQLHSYLDLLRASGVLKEKSPRLQA
jgi:O-antigen/teichoic acid export membrane protein